MSEHTYRAIAGVLAVCGALLLLFSPAVGAHAAGHLAANSSAGATGEWLELGQPGRLEILRVIGGFLFGGGLLGFVHAGGAPKRANAR